MMTKSTVDEAKSVCERLKTEFDKIAVCHCGDLCKNHNYSCGHDPSWMECEASKLLDDAQHVIGVLLYERETSCFCHRKKSLWKSIFFFVKGVICSLMMYRQTQDEEIR